jgi:hypothetical protein
MGPASTLVSVAIWGPSNEPVKRQVVGWTPDSLPPDWRDRRDPWDYAHVASAGVQLLGLAAQVLDLIQDD